jgi:DNA-binding LacI/PurR family transcriptional regulator
MAIGFMNGIRNGGLAMPRDLSIIGFDGTEKSEYCNPLLTPMRQPLAEMGTRVAGLLVDAMKSPKSKPSRPIVCKSELVVRGTTAAPG